MIGTEDGPCLFNSAASTSGSQFNADLARAQTAKTLGLTMTWVDPPHGFPLLFNQNYMLTLMSQAGLQTWLSCDDGGPRSATDSLYKSGWWTRPWNVDTANAITNRAKSHNPTLRAAQLGYFVATEPSTDTTVRTFIKNWIAHIHANDPTKLGYLTVREFGPDEDAAAYSAYLDTWFNDPDSTRRPDVLSYDHYPFLHEEDVCGNTGVRRNYFANLAIARDRALGRPIWLYISTQKYWYRPVVSGPCADGIPTEERLRPDPTPGMLRFQLYSPLAYGVKGLFYWNYQQAPHEYEGAPYIEGNGIIAGCDSTTGFKYEELKTNNRYIADIVGPTIMSDAFIGAYHKSKWPTEEVVPQPYTLAASTVVTLGQNDTDILYGVFAGANNTQHLLVVNKEWRQATTMPVTITLRGDYRGKVLASPSPIGYSGTVTWTPESTTYNSSFNRTSFTILSLEAGEGRLFRLLKDGVPPSSSALTASGSYPSLTFSWTVPGDDYSFNGYGTRYEIRGSSAAITAMNFTSAALVDSGPLVSGSGTPISQKTVNLGSCPGARYYAIQFADDVGNTSAIGPNAYVTCGSHAAEPRTEVAGAAVLKLLPPAPNPARTALTLRFSVPAELTGSPLSLDVFDLSGRRIANVRSGPAVAGDAVTTWDLRDRQGNRVRPGFYVARLQIADRRLRHSFMIQ